MITRKSTRIKKVNENPREVIEKLVFSEEF